MHSAGRRWLEGGKGWWISPAVVHVQLFTGLAKKQKGLLIETEEMAATAHGTAHPLVVYSAANISRSKEFSTVGLLT